MSVSQIAIDNFVKMCKKVNDEEFDYYKTTPPEEIEAYNFLIDMPQEVFGDSPTSLPFNCGVEVFSAKNTYDSIAYIADHTKLDPTLLLIYYLAAEYKNLDSDTAFFTTIKSQTKEIDLLNSIYECIGEWSPITLYNNPKHLGSGESTLWIFSLKACHAYMKSIRIKVT